MWANESERTREVALRALRAAKEREEARRRKNAERSRGPVTPLTADALSRLSCASDVTSVAMEAGRVAGEGAARGGQQGGGDWNDDTWSDSEYSVVDSLAELASLLSFHSVEASPSAGARSALPTVPAATSQIPQQPISLTRASSLPAQSSNPSLMIPPRQQEHQVEGSMGGQQQAATPSMAEMLQFARHELRQLKRLASERKAPLDVVTEGEAATSSLAS